jgi:predicted O-linked N-acetylglucosamine transferase (SPINDLY family)
MGADFIDYMLADRIVIPAEHARFYTENVVWLPDSYMANDATRTIAEPMPTRRACGLPDDGFVFCCFNNAYKISPAVFAVWMRLLQAVEGSILWLGEADPAAEDNLRREAARHGVAAQRLIFAPKLPDMADHLARQRLADLFLDTLPYNAHATASDALWTGLPVLTCLGTAFAGRVGASLLRAAGLAELVTETLRDYETLACRLAREPALLAAAKAKLAHGRDGCALFDTARFTRHIEAAFSTMWQRHQRGEPAQGFAVDGAAPPHG